MASGTRGSPPSRDNFTERLHDNRVTERKLTLLKYAHAENLKGMARNLGHSARVTAAGFSDFRNKQGDWIYRGMYGAKIITFAKSEPRSSNDSRSLSDGLLTILNPTGQKLHL